MSSHFPPLLPVVLSLLAASAAPAIVINEIHYNPPNNPVRQEFIELYNPGDSEVVLTGWRISGAVSYPFPDDTRLAAGEYLVIAEDPPTLLSTLGSQALGPFGGSLDSEGETVRLRNGNDEVVDLADYKVGFPWPVEANGGGASIELINPGLDNSLGSSWRAALNHRSTPGQLNSVFAANAAPSIRKVNHTPREPGEAEPVLVTALITDPDGVAEVTLEYQLVGPGAYIPSHLPLQVRNGGFNVFLPRQVNPSYSQNWIGIQMLDDGTEGDAVAGDDIFTARLPGQLHRSLVRYRITVEDELGLSARVPYPDDAALNFAYFVYNGVPDYNGHSAATLETLPVYHLITRGADYRQCFAYNSSDQINQGNDARFYYNWNGAIVYDGVVYDNIRYRLRGANGRYHRQGKRSMRFRFNDGHYFQARDQRGKKYQKAWRTLTTGKGFDNRGTLTYGLNEALSMALYNKVGVPGPDTHWIHWRVIDGEEAPDRWRGDFHGLNFVLETYDVRFMEAHGLEKGNLYKLINQTQDWRRQQRYQGAFAWADGRDMATIEGSLTGSSTPAFIREYVNMEKWNRWHALAEAIRLYDFWPSSNKNMTYYFEPAYSSRNRGNGKLWILPWDTDASWGPTWNSGHDVVYNALFPASGGGSDSASTPELWPAYFSAVRELRDLLWQPDQIEPLIEEFAAVIAPFEAADAARWKGAPADAGNYSGLGGAGASSLANLVQDMKNFAFVGGSWPGGNVGAGGRAAHLDTLQGSQSEGTRIPRKPSIRYNGAPGYPTDGLSFLAGPFSDPQGVATFAAMEWRVAEITDPSAPGYDPAEGLKLEWDASWESGELPAEDRILALPTVAVRSGRTYRARVRYKDTSGRWSNWSAAHEFTTTLPDISGYLDGLVISEVMYHPAEPSAEEFEAGFTDDDAFEFIELRNVGSVSLNLSELRFTKGVDFDFLDADITSLAPGGFVLIVANRAAFELRYGSGHPIAGEWDSNDKLNNGGERLKLSFGAGDGIHDFVFDDEAPWPVDPDGSGVSLTLGEPASRPDHGVAENWRASFAPGGTPGEDEPSGPFGKWMTDRGATDPLAPFGNAPYSNLLAYALGADLVASPQEALPTISHVTQEGVTYPVLRYRVRSEAHDVIYTAEVSEDLVNWRSGGAFTIPTGVVQDNADGTVTMMVRVLESRDSVPSQYLRLRVSRAGGGGSETFAEWMASQGTADPHAPFRSTSLSHLLAYSLGADLGASTSSMLPGVKVVNEDGMDYPALSFRVRQDAPEVHFVVEVSADLVLWESGGAFTARVGAPINNGDGTITLTVRTQQALAASGNQYLRLRTSVDP